MTTKAIKARVLNWRAEIAAELAQANKEISPLMTAHETATEQLRAIAAEYGQTQQYLGTIIEKPEAPLQRRYDAHLDEVNQARARKARAAADLEAARARANELQLALDQIDRAIAVEDTQEATS